MTIWNSGEINILSTENFSQLSEQDINGVDLVISDTPIPGGLIYPTKIVFQLEVPENLETFLSKFESSKRSSIKKRIRTTEQELETMFLDPIDIETFQKWEIGYKKFINSLSDGRAYANLEWFKTAQEGHIGIFFVNKQTGEFEGGSLIKKFTESSKLSMSYAWYSERAKEVGASTTLICKLIEFAISNNYKYISFGQDANLYGGHLALGLEEFKSGWKASATAANKTEYKYIKVIEPIKNKFKFYFKEGDNLKLYKSYE